MHVNKLRTTRKQNKGFTLIELLIVVAVIGILTALVFPNLQGMRQRARDVKRKAHLSNISKALKMYNNNLGRYPASNSNNIVGCTDRVAPIECAWGEEFSDGTSTYISKLPLDPSSTSSSPKVYNYHQTSSDDFVIVAELEIHSDSDAEDSQEKCDTAYNDYQGPKTDYDYVVCE